MDDTALGELELIVPNLHWRYSGVTAANRTMAPRLARLARTAWLGRDAPAGVVRMSLGDLVRLRWRKGGAGRVIWHARRNNEMLAGVLLRLLGWPLILVFTSAAQRHHTWITRLLLARMDGLVATTEAAASYLQRHATVIPHGVDTARYAPPQDRGRAFAAAGLPGKYGIGCFGRVRAQKGTDVFVAAMCEVLPKYPDFCAVIIGPIDDETFAAALEARIETAGLTGRIRILGELPIDEVPLWYQRILIYAFTSRVEGFGLTLLEAMASGNALVAARAGAADKVVVEGETGILVAPGDADALARALEPLLRDPQRALEMGQRARTLAVEKFSADVEARRIAEFHRKIRQAAGR